MTTDPGGRPNEGNATRIITIEVNAKTLEKQRMVYSALTDLMSGMNAPVHAIDNLETLIPEN